VVTSQTNICQYPSKPTNGSTYKEDNEYANQWIHEAIGQFEQIALQQCILSFHWPTTLIALVKAGNIITDSLSTHYYKHYFFRIFCFCAVRQIKLAISSASERTLIYRIVMYCIK